MCVSRAVMCACATRMWGVRGVIVIAWMMGGVSLPVCNRCHCGLFLRCAALARSVSCFCFIISRVASNNSRSVASRFNCAFCSSSSSVWCDSTMSIQRVFGGGGGESALPAV